MHSLWVLWPAGPQDRWKPLPQEPGSGAWRQSRCHNQRPPHPQPSWAAVWVLGVARTLESRAAKSKVSQFNGFGILGLHRAQLETPGSHTETLTNRESDMRAHGPVHPGRDDTEPP